MESADFDSSYLNSAKTKGERQEGDGKKNVTTICDKRHHALWARRLVWGTGPHPLEPGRGSSAKGQPSPRGGRQLTVSENSLEATPLSER